MPVFGDRNLRGSRLLSHFAYEYQPSGGVGWTNNLPCRTFSCACTHTSCYAVKAAADDDVDNDEDLDEDEDEYEEDEDEYE